MSGMSPARMYQEVVRHLDPRAQFTTALGVVSITRPDPRYSTTIVQAALNESKEWWWDLLVEHDRDAVTRWEDYVLPATALGEARLDQPGGVIAPFMQLVRVEDRSADLQGKRIVLWLVGAGQLAEQDAISGYYTGSATYSDGTLRLGGPPGLDRTLRFFVVPQAEDLDITDTRIEPDIPPQYHHGVVYKAVVDLMAREDRLPRGYDRMQAMLGNAVERLQSLSAGKKTQSIMPTYTRP